MIKISLTSVMVDDQPKALDFYTNKLGFLKKIDVDLGGGARWLTLVSPSQPDGVQLLLEPDNHPAAGPFKQALVKDRIPATAFEVEDIQKEYARMKAAGVVFHSEPKAMGPTMAVTLDDTCGNLIQLFQKL